MVRLMRPRMVRLSAVVVGLLTCLSGAGGAIAGDVAPLAASFDYAMPSRFRVPALPATDATFGPESPTRYFVGAVKPDHWHVDLDACASTGPIASYEWTLDGQPLASSASCDGTFFEVPEEGAHEVTLRVLDGHGASASATRRVVVQDWLLVGLGDSYGSGEGVPDVPVSQLALDAVAAAQAAVLDAQTAFAQSLAAYTTAQQDLNALLPLLNTAISRYNAWVAAVNDVDVSCGNLPPTPVQCAAANAALVTATAQLTSALSALGLEYLFGDPTLIGVLTNWKTSLQNAYDVALAAKNAADAALAAAQQSLAQAWDQVGPRWQNRRCHRSANSGQVLAAQRLEDADPHTSVTFLHLACSGATTWKGLIGGYGGQEQWDGEDPDGDLVPQIAAAADLTEGREVDGAIVSIGGNDVRFADVITNCITKEPCYDEHAADDPDVATFFSDYCAPLGILSGLCEQYLALTSTQFPGNAHDMFFLGTDPDHEDLAHHLGLDDLPAAYDAVQNQLWSQAWSGKLTGLFEQSGRERIYLTAYPSITRREGDAPGAPTELCGFDPGAPIDGRLKNLPGLTLPEVDWADTVVAPQLASTMKASADEHRWRFVDGHVARFDGHGYCADANWLVRIPQSIRGQIRPSLEPTLDMLTNSANGSVHPNALGQQAYAGAIFAALLCDLYPGCDPAAEPRVPALAPVPLPGAKLALVDNASKPAKRKLRVAATTPLLAAPVPGPGDPTKLGGVLRVSSTSGADDAVLALPAAGWKGLGKPAGAKGWKYSDKSRSRGPCTSVVVKPGKKLRATCKGEGIPFTLDEDAQDAILVTLALGDDPAQCLLFGGSVQKNRPAIGKKNGLFKAKNAPAPAACPLP